MTCSTPVPFKAGGFKALPQSLDYAAQSHASMRFFNNAGTDAVHCTYTALREQALQLAGVLSDYGFPRGSKIAMIAQTRVEFHTLFFACQYAGLIPCPLPLTLLPNGQEAYIALLTQLLSAAQAVLLVTPASIEPVIQSVGQKHPIPVISYETLSQQASTQTAEHVLTAPLQEHEAAYIQFSSGSTSAPRGIEVSQQAVMANLNIIAQNGMQIIEEEKVFSWLPFHHDMGLVGFVLSPVNTQSSVDFLSPEAFMRKPELWLELMSSGRSTLTFAPVFAYALAAQKIQSPEKLDLSALRVAGIGGDMVRASTLKEFARHMAPSGFRFDAFCPCYGLAEATMAVTMTRPDDPPVIKQFSDTGHAQELVGCGTPLPGFSIQIEHAQQSVSVAHEVGEVWVKGPSVIQPKSDQHAQAPAHLQGYMPTGDLGFVWQNNLFITGRAKDMIIVRGRNIWAQDVEWTISEHDKAIKEQDIATIGIERNDEEHLVVLVHSLPSEDDNQRALRQKNMQQVVNQTFGVSAQIVWLAPEQLVTTSSGKLARAEIKKRYLDKTLSIISS